MPLYEFVCPAAHKTERITSRTTELIACSCGQAASRTAVNRVNFNTRGGLASEFVMPSSMRAAHEEARGYAAEVRAIAAEERANGYV